MTKEDELDCQQNHLFFCSRCFDCPMSVVDVSLSNTFIVSTQKISLNLAVKRGKLAEKAWNVCVFTQPVSENFFTFVEVVILYSVLISVSYNR